MSVDPRISTLKLEKQQLQIDLKAINTQMTNIRANYSERQSNIFFKPSRHQKDAQLRKLEPQKQKLQQQILVITQEIALIQAGKK
jgi:methionine aminopeptidase